MDSNHEDTHKNAYNRGEWVKEHFVRLVRFDTIRLDKLVEITQYTIISYFLGWVVAAIINGFLLRYSENLEDYKTFTLILLMMISVIILTVAAYYIGKIVSVVPALFPVDVDYVPSKKGESGVGIGVGLGLSYFSQIPAFYSVMGEVGKRLAPNKYVFNRI